MKRFLTAIFILLATSAYAQKITHLEYVGTGDVLKPNEAIIYGSFIQRLTFWQTGYQQDIRIRNVATNELFAFEVKPSLRSRKENSFCFYIKPGTYEVINYYYSKAKWYGVQNNVRPVFKNIDYEVNLKNKIDSGIVKFEDLKRLVFKVDNNTITYIGQWHFEAGPVWFTDDKSYLDKKLQTDFFGIEFKAAGTVLPD